MPSMHFMTGVLPVHQEPGFTLTLIFSCCHISHLINVTHYQGISILSLLLLFNSSSFECSLSEMHTRSLIFLCQVIQSHLWGGWKFHLKISRSFIQKFCEILWNWIPNFYHFSIKPAGQLKWINKGIFLIYFLFLNLDY